MVAFILSLLLPGVRSPPTAFCAVAAVALVTIRLVAA